MSDPLTLRSRPVPQEYMALQEALGGALRAGFLSLAQARYSMGADRVSALQLPAHMTATARLSAGAPPPPAAGAASLASTSATYRLPPSHCQETLLTRWPEPNHPSACCRRARAAGAGAGGAPAPAPGSQRQRQCQLS